MRILPVGKLNSGKFFSTQGLTLLLLIAVCLLGVAIWGGGHHPGHELRKTDAAIIHLRKLEVALDQHRLDTFKYPDTLEGLVKNTMNSPKWSGPYIKSGIPKDPWGRDYQYQKPGRDGRNYDLYSFGADGQEGGEGENADITSWQTSK